MYNGVKAMIEAENAISEWGANQWAQQPESWETIFIDEASKQLGAINSNRQSLTRTTTSNMLLADSFWMKNVS